MQQEPEPEPRARIRFRFFLGQNDTVPAVPVPAPVPQHWSRATNYQNNEKFFPLGFHISSHHKIQVKKSLFLTFCLLLEDTYHNDY
jgi:hypothetical protein